MHKCYSNRAYTHGWNPVSQLCRHVGHLQVRVFLSTFLFFIFYFFCHLPPLSSFEMMTTPSTSQAHGLAEKQPLFLFFFFYIIIYDLLDFIDFLFTPTKSNKQNIIIKRRWRLLCLLFSLPSYTLTHYHHKYDAASPSTFLFTKSTTF